MPPFAVGGTTRREKAMPTFPPTCVCIRMFSFCWLVRMHTHMLITYTQASRREPMRAETCTVVCIPSLPRNQKNLETSASGSVCILLERDVRIRQHTPAYVSIRQQAMPRHIEL